MPGVVGSEQVARRSACRRLVLSERLVLSTVRAWMLGVAYPLPFVYLARSLFFGPRVGRSLGSTRGFHNGEPRSHKNFVKTRLSPTTPMPIHRKESLFHNRGDAGKDGFLWPS